MQTFQTARWCKYYLHITAVLHSSSQSENWTTGIAVMNGRHHLMISAFQTCSIWDLLRSLDFFGFLRISLFFINSPRSQLTGESQSVSKELAPQEEQSVIQAKAAAPCDMRHATDATCDANRCNHVVRHGTVVPCFVLWGGAEHGLLPYT